MKERTRSTALHCTPKGGRTDVPIGMVTGNISGFGVPLRGFPSFLPPGPDPLFFLLVVSAWLWLCGPGWLGVARGVPDLAPQRFFFIFEKRF